MAIVEMTKRQVIEVLRKEKLTHGTFGHDTGKGCAFCAVGQVARAALRTTERVNVVSDVAHGAVYRTDETGLVKRRRSPLAGLERAFERVWENGFDASEKERKRVVAWARKELPARVRIDIGDAKPRRGMKVVE